VHCGARGYNCKPIRASTCRTPGLPSWARSSPSCWSPCCGDIRIAPPWERRHPAGLVDQVKRWPGVHFAKSILGGKPLKGLWFNRTEEYAAKNRGEDFGRLKYAEEEELMLSQLPCWADLTPEQYRERIAELVEEIEAEAQADREARGIEPLGVEAILKQDPHTRPNQTKKSPAPAYHAATKAARQSFWEAYSTFVAAFREAADKLKAGDRTARFPLGSFPPALPFVIAYPSLPP
jgi:hypothetical protein